MSPIKIQLLLCLLLYSQYTANIEYICKCVDETFNYFQNTCYDNK